MLQSEVSAHAIAISPLLSSCLLDRLCNLQHYQIWNSCPNEGWEGGREGGREGRDTPDREAVPHTLSSWLDLVWAGVRGVERGTPDQVTLPLARPGLA